MIYNLFTKFEFKDIRINGSDKNSPHLYPKTQGGCGGVLKNDLQLVYKTG